MSQEIVRARHVDVAILYGQSQKDRAQHIARKLRPVVWHMDRQITEETKEKIRERMGDK